VLQHPWKIREVRHDLVHPSRHVLRHVHGGHEIRVFDDEETEMALLRDPQAEEDLCDDRARGVAGPADQCGEAILLDEADEMGLGVYRGAA
jgi:hypothetical protein